MSEVPDGIVASQTAQILRHLTTQQRLDAHVQYTIDVIKALVNTHDEGEDILQNAGAALVYVSKKTEGAKR